MFDGADKEIDNRQSKPLGRIKKLLKMNSRLRLAKKCLLSFQRNKKNKF